MAAAPKGNKFALFNKGGQPRKYKSPEQMAEKIQEYFDSFFEDIDGIQIMSGRPTVTGLALFLEFADRKSLYEYRDKFEEYSSLIKKALTAVEMNYEEMLQTKHVSGAIFALKNMGWKDQYYNDHTTDGDKIGEEGYDLSKLSLSELKKLRSLQNKAKQND